MIRKSLLLAAFVPVLVLPLSACGGSGSKLYDAKATYSCLRHRPEYRPSSFNWYPGEPGVRRPPALAFWLGQPPPRGARYAGQWPIEAPNVGPSWGFGPMSVTGEAASVRIAMFDKTRSAQAAYRTIMGQIPAAFRAQSRQTIKVIRNAYIDTQGGPRVKQMMAIVLGCLRTA